MKVRLGRMEGKFTITCAFSAYHHSTCDFESRPWR